jgi:thioredoxin-like negative regulator of GroEL
VKAPATLGYCRPPPPDPRWLVICLCADWCGTCRDYRPTLLSVAAGFPGYAFAWIDIEDEPDIAGEIDIETFPTLLVLDDEQVLFYGPLLPGAESLTRLLRALDENGPQPTALDDEVRELVRRLRQG